MHALLGVSSDKRPVHNSLQTQCWRALHAGVWRTCTCSQAPQLCPISSFFGAYSTYTGSDGTQDTLQFGASTSVPTSFLVLTRQSLLSEHKDRHETPRTQLPPALRCRHVGRPALGLTVHQRPRRQPHQSRPRLRLPLRLVRARRKAMSCSYPPAMAKQPKPCAARSTGNWRRSVRPALARKNALRATHRATLLHIPRLV